MKRRTVHRPRPVPLPVADGEEWLGRLLDHLDGHAGAGVDDRHLDGLVAANSRSKHGYRRAFVLDIGRLLRPRQLAWTAAMRSV